MKGKISPRLTSGTIVSSVIKYYESLPMNCVRVTCQDFLILMSLIFNSMVMDHPESICSFGIDSIILR